MPTNKAARLKVLEMKLRADTELPLYADRLKNEYQPVFGEGSAEAAILFIGEAPGKQEALKGRPFVGSSGRTLDSLLESIGLERGDVYIANILKDRPPGNRAPQPKEIAAYTPYLRKQIEIIAPRVIVTLGRFAMEFILSEYKLPEAGAKISELHGRPLRTRAPFGEVTVLPLYHPAVALYRRDQLGVLKEDFQVLRECAGTKKS